MRVPSALLAASWLIAAVPALAETTPYADLPGTTWMATEWNGVAPKPGLAPRLTFDPGNRFVAYAGCNRHMGRYTVRDDLVAFEHQVSTKMACYGERGETDERLIADLKRTQRLALASDGTLVARAADSALIWRFRRAATRD